MPMPSQVGTLEDLGKRAQAYAPIRVAVVAADQGLVLQTLREATSLGLIEARLIGDPDAILVAAEDASVEIDRPAILMRGTRPSRRVPALISFGMVRSMRL